MNVQPIPKYLWTYFHEGRYKVYKNGKEVEIKKGVLKGCGLLECLPFKSEFEIYDMRPIYSRSYKVVQHGTDCIGEEVYFLVKGEKLPFLEVDMVTPIEKTDFNCSSMKDVGNGVICDFGLVSSRTIQKKSNLSKQIYQDFSTKYFPKISIDYVLNL